MNARSFFSSMSKKEFCAKLQHFYNGLDEDAACSFERSMKTIPRRAEGKPVSQGNLKIFQQIDVRLEQGCTIAAAIRTIVEGYSAGVKGYPDCEDRIETITREYRRYRRTRDAGLDPSRTYDDESLAEFILSKQFALAAAIFAVADAKRRARICDKLNARIVHRVFE